jgi:S-adenosylmethionine synthetase
VGFAPLTQLEKIVLAVERRLNAPDTKLEFPACGQDVKIMGVRDYENITLTIACALIGRFLPGLEAYADAKRRVAEIARDAARSLTDKPVDVLVNAADDPKRGAIYLTATGTSAESGDDGETGRGNRSNGLITPSRPMTLEAAAGKNPLTHVGKLYGAAAQQIAENVVGDVAEIKAAECYLVSRIGAPIDQPQAVIVRVDTVDGHIDLETERRVDEIVARQMAGIARLWERFLTGELPVC